MIDASRLSGKFSSFGEFFDFFVQPMAPTLARVRALPYEVRRSCTFDAIVGT
jgi:hypothetical protein